MPSIDIFYHGIEVLGVLFAIYKFHQSNVGRVQKMHADNKEELAKINMKLEMLYRWFERNIINKQ